MSTYQDILDVFKTLKIDFRINDINEAKEVFIDGEWQPLHGTLESVIRTRVYDLPPDTWTGKKPNVNQLEDAWITLGHSQRHNPVHDYFDRLRRSPYTPQKTSEGYYFPHEIYSTINTYFDNQDGLFWRWLYHWMIGCIAKVYNQERNPILVIGGPQDQGKSSFSRWLCPLPDYYREGELKPDSKDEKIRLTDILIQEIPELGSSTKRADVEAFKDHITRKEVVERPAYGKIPMRKKTMCSFIATINLDGAGFLMDDTGSTRFLICEIEAMDFELINTRTSDGLWREALWFYDELHRAWELSDEEKRMRDEINATHKIVNALDDVIDYILEITHDNDDFTTTLQIRQAITPHYRVANENGFAREIARALKGRGLQSGKAKYEPGKPHHRGWYGVKIRDVETLL